ncbi:hypothetical protein [Streptosporangium amethystogenes]|uniref:hypothetical protein n=1 Tax=Streptosporangium amethystogenes TaxID=2002 RepID=UPI0004C487EA|nr:hypothetical protein [Streptosporangium amethystogenes]
MTLLDLLIEFGRTGQVGPLHCGMPLDQAEELLGPGRPHPAIQLKGPDLDGYPYSWASLDLVVTQRSVSGIWIRLRPGASTHLPAAVLPDSQTHSATVLREDFISALDATGCPHELDQNLTFGTQSSIRTHPADVCAVFFPPHKDEHVSNREGLYLGVIHKHIA